MTVVPEVRLSQWPTEDVQITLVRGGLADLHRIVAEIGADRRIAHTARTVTSEDKGIDPSGQRTELAHRREVSDVGGVDYQPQIFGRETFPEWNPYLVRQPHFTS